MVCTGNSGGFVEVERMVRTDKGDICGKVHVCNYVCMYQARIHTSLHRSILQVHRFISKCIGQFLKSPLTIS